jgi:MFS family permease
MRCHLLKGILPLFKKLKSIYYGYIIVSAAFVIMAMIWGMWATFGVFFDPLLKEFGWTRAAASGASSLNNILFGLVCIFSAGLSDKLGPRKVIIGCSILLGISYFLMSRVESLWEMYLYFGVLVSLGMSSYIPLLSLVARWFTRRRGMVTGIVFSGMGLGTMLLPLAANQLIVYYSWRMAFIILAVLALALTLIAALFMKAAPEHSRGEPNNEPGRGSTFMEAVRTRQFILLCVLYFCFLFCLVTIMVHVVIHGIGLGIAAADAAFILAIIGGACIVGMNVMGAASDRAGIRLAMVISFALMALSLAWLLYAGTAWALYLFAVIFGFAYGGMQTLFSPLVAELFGLRSHGIILGAAAFIGTVGAVIGPIFAGYIFDAMGSYSYAFLICAILAGGGIAVSLFIKAVQRTGR